MHVLSAENWKPLWAVGSLPRTMLGAHSAPQTQLVERGLLPHPQEPHPSRPSASPNENSWAHSLHILPSPFSTVDGFIGVSFSVVNKALHFNELTPILFCLWP